MMLRLTPSIPMICPRGEGEAIICIDPDREHHLQWVIILENGQIWTYENHQVRANVNETIGRTKIDIPEDWKLCL